MQFETASTSHGIEKKESPKLSSAPAPSHDEDGDIKPQEHKHKEDAKPVTKKEKHSEDGKKSGPASHMSDVEPKYNEKIPERSGNSRCNGCVLI
jgi:hypothetical protein